MDLALQMLSTDKTVRNDTIQDLTEFISQSLSTQAKKGEQLVYMIPAIKKAFNLMGDDIVELSTESDASKSKIGSYDQKLLEESKQSYWKISMMRKEQIYLCLEWKSKWINVK